jgi:hypothetical protein
MKDRIRNVLVGAAAIGLLVGVGAGHLMLCYWLRGPMPDPRPRMAPREWSVNELQPEEATETWEDYAARMEAAGKEPVR